MTGSGLERLQAVSRQLAGKAQESSDENALPPMQHVADGTGRPRLAGKVVIITGES
jgi:hypothetical protein